MSSSFFLSLNNNVSLFDSGICYNDIFRYKFQSTTSAFDGNLQGSCRDASGQTHHWARASSVPSIDACKSKCEGEIIPLNTGNVYRGVTFRTINTGTLCYCFFDNSVSVPGVGWSVSGARAGSGPATKHSGEPGFQCVPVVACLNQMTIAVGASGSYQNAYVGGAYIYTGYDGDGGWDLQADIPMSGVSKVAISGDILATGLGRSDGGCGTNSGIVHVYHRSGSTWTQQASITDPGCGTSNSFGRSLDIYNDMLIVGQPSGGTYQGRVYTFRQSNDTWPLFQQTDGLYESNQFGNIVVMGDDYHFMAMGYPESSGMYYGYNGDGASSSPEDSPQDISVYMVDLFVSSLASFVDHVCFPHSRG